MDFPFPLRTFAVHFVCMDNSRDSSVWRSLAVAFGDGLAFGVGMKLSQNAPAKAGAPARPELSNRLAAIEARMHRLEEAPATIAGSANLDPNVLEALTRALEARLQESAALLDRRLAELDVKLAVELKALQQQDRWLASEMESRLSELQNRFDHRVLDLLQKVDQDRNTLQSQVISLHREFAAAVADIVEEQVATQVEEHVSKLAEDRLTGLVRAQLDPLEQRLRDEFTQASAAKDREMAELRQRLLESDRNVLEVILAMGEICRQAAGRLSSDTGQPGTTRDILSPAEDSQPPTEMPDPSAKAPEERARAAGESTGIPSRAPEAIHANGLFRDSDLPGFAQPRKAAAVALSIPLVTSFLVTAGCVVLLQYF